VAAGPLLEAVGASTGTSWSRSEARPRCFAAARQGRRSAADRRPAADADARGL